MAIDPDVEQALNELRADYDATFTGIQNEIATLASAVSGATFHADSAAVLSEFTTHLATTSGEDRDNFISAVRGLMA